jgi:hypothetical protein
LKQGKRGALQETKSRLKLMTIEELRPYQDKTATLRLYNGEIATVKIVLVDAEYDDIVVEIIQTNRPQQYKGPAGSTYTIQAVDIASVDEASNSDTV